jgi:Flp pilus assembly secretin CpaC
MRLVTASFLAILLGLPPFVRAQQPPPPEPKPGQATDKALHLLQAADHLEAAGMADEAAEMRRSADRLRDETRKQKIVDRMLKQKVSELERLRAEVEELRRATGFVDQILFKVQAVQVSVARVHEDGLGLDDVEMESCRTVFPSLFHADGDEGGPKETATLQAFDSQTVTAAVEALRKTDVLKILAEPTLATVDQLPSSFAIGGEFPYPAVHPDKSLEIQHRPYGIHVDLVPKLLGGQKVRLEFRGRFSELDPSLSITVQGISVPGLRVVEMASRFDVELGRTTVLGGLAQERNEKPTDAETKHESSSRNPMQTYFLVTAEIAEVPASRDTDSARVIRSTRTR